MCGLELVWVPGGGVQNGTEPAAGRMEGQNSEAEAVTPTEGNGNSKRQITASYGLPRGNNHLLNRWIGIYC